MLDSGVIAVDKGLGLTSSDCVQRLRFALGLSRIGHAGTLDPYATGVLLVAYGVATKLCPYLSAGTKTYSAKIRLGECRDTFDRFGAVTAATWLPLPGTGQVADALKSFEGEHEQLVPAFSAARYQGGRRYAYARRGEPLPPKHSLKTIRSIALEDYSPPFVRITVDCDPGTYVRSLAHQLGERLGCGAHLYALVRTRVGKFTLAEALTLGQLEALHRLGKSAEVVTAPEKALPFPVVTVADLKSVSVRAGQRISVADILSSTGRFETGETICIQSASGALLAVGAAEVASDEISGQRNGSEAVFRYKRVI